MSPERISQIRAVADDSHPFGAMLVECLDEIERLGPKPKGPNGNFIVLPDSVVDDYLSGMSLGQVAERYGVGIFKIVSFLESNGVARRKRGQVKGHAPTVTKLKPGQPEEIVALYGSGRTMQSIGEEFGISRERVRQLWSIAGCAPKMALRSSAAEARKAERKARVDSRKEFMRRRVEAASSLWKSGADAREVTVAFGLVRNSIQGCANLIGYLRARHGVKMFPYRYRRAVA